MFLIYNMVTCSFFVVFRKLLSSDLCLNVWTERIWCLCQTTLWYKVKSSLQEREPLRMFENHLSCLHILEVFISKTYSKIYRVCIFSDKVFFWMRWGFSPERLGHSHVHTSVNEYIFWNVAHCLIVTYRSKWAPSYETTWGLNKFCAACKARIVCVLFCLSWYLLNRGVTPEELSVFDYRNNTYIVKSIIKSLSYSILCFALWVPDFPPDVVMFSEFVLFLQCKISSPFCTVEKVCHVIPCRGVINLL